MTKEPRETSDPARDLIRQLPAAEMPVAPQLTPEIANGHESLIGTAEKGEFLSIATNLASVRNAKLIVEKGAMSSTQRKTTPSSAAKKRTLNKLRNVILSEHQKCVSAVHSTVLHAIKVGEGLLAARDIIRHGEWAAWVEKNFSEETGLTKKTAERYMRITREIGKVIAELRNNANDQYATRLSELTDQEVLQDVSLAQAYRIAASLSTPTKKTRLTNSDLEWLTPQPIILSAEDFLGEIHCDPCAADIDNVPVLTRYRASDDGLHPDAHWGHTAFISPGLSANTALFVEKTVSLFHNKLIEEAILVLPLVSDTAWSKSVQQFPRAIVRCAMEVEYVGGKKCGRLKFPVEIVCLASFHRFAAFATSFQEVAEIVAPFDLIRSAIP